MGFLDSIKNAASQAVTGFNKFKNKSFMEGVVAGAVLISMADGSIDAEEKTKLLNFFKASEDLSCFSPADVGEAFSKIEKLISFDPDSGKAEAFRILGKLRDDPEQARMVVRTVIAIANADGNFDNSEKDMARQICKELNVAPGDFDL